MYRHTLLGMLLLAGLALTIAGCGGGNDNEGMGTLKVGITDQAVQGVESVVLAISEVRVVQAGNESGQTAGLARIVTFSPARVVDVMDLQFEQQLLGEAVVPAGDYSQVRLVLAPNVSGEEPVNYVTYADAPTQRVALRTPSGQESGLKVVGRFDVQAGEINTIVLDFDPSRAIVEAGPNLNLKPTGIRIMQLADVLSTFGALTGMVSPAGSRSTAFVSIIPQGQTQPIAKGTVNPETGEFRALLPQGNYYARIEALGYHSYNGSLLPVPAFFSVIIGHDTAAGEFQLSASN